MTSSAERAKKMAFSNNRRCKTSSALARCVPMAIWSSSLESYADIYKAIKNDAEFTHPDQDVHDAIFIFTIAIHYLLNNPSDPDRASKAYDIALLESSRLDKYR
jgi:hypothetical protein